VRHEGSPETADLQAAAAKGVAVGRRRCEGRWGWMGPDFGLPLFGPKFSWSAEDQIFGLQDQIIVAGSREHVKIPFQNHCFGARISIYLLGFGVVGQA
jgi:hypothetical protein